MTDVASSLTVRGESVQILYSQYRSRLLLANRRYQRKLVWAVEEKNSFIDSLRQSLPVPLILVAEVSEADSRHLEVIDGLQRLNAVFSFIENEYCTDSGRYFDLASLAETKQLLDASQLKQREPVLSRQESVTIARYTLPISVFRSDSNEDIEEIFRRINSNGRHLSRQEIRQAGSLSPLAACVRKIAEGIRGDYSISDKVPLLMMPEISIASTPEGPGVPVDEIFWVKQRILDREQVRMSRDEEIVADLILSVAIDPMPAYDSRLLDEYYGLVPSRESRLDQISVAISKYSVEGLQQRFDAVMAVFEEVFDAEHPFSTHFFSSPKQRVPRYFESVFLGLHGVMFGKGLSVIDTDGVRRELASFGSKHLDIPGGGGTWTGLSKGKNVNVVAGVIERHAIAPTPGVDSSPSRNAVVVERYLRAAAVEAARLEFKQGFSRLSSPPKPDDGVVRQIAETATAMANLGPGAEGYIIVGVADKEADAIRVETLLNSSCPELHGHRITGLGADYLTLKNLDGVLLWLSQKLRDLPFDSRLRDSMLQDVAIAEFHGRDVLMFSIADVGEPVAMGDKFYVRSGPQTVEIAGTEIGRLYAKFGSGASV